MQKAEQDYIQRLDAQMRQLGGAGRIAEAAVVKAEITRVQNHEPAKADGGKISEPLATLRRNYESGLATALRPVRQAYAQKLEALVRQLGAAARIDGQGCRRGLVRWRSSGKGKLLPGCA